jgi:large conductance mechanosensitive channel
MSFLREFRDFAARGNVIDLAVGIIIGAAFGKIVSSFVKDVVMPPIGYLIGGIDFSEIYINLSRTHYANLAEATKAGAPTINVGVFVNTLIDFLIIAFAIFLIVRLVNRLKSAPPPPAADATSRDCPYCLSTVPIKASRCAHCTSELPSVETSAAQ